MKTNTAVELGTANGTKGIIREVVPEHTLKIVLVGVGSQISEDCIRSSDFGVASGLLGEKTRYEEVSCAAR